MAKIGHHAGPAAAIRRRRFVRHAPRDRLHLRIGSLRAYARRQPRHDAKPSTATILEFSDFADLRPRLLREPEIAVTTPIDRAKIRRQDADHGREKRAATLDPDLLADDLRIAAIMVLPEAIAEYDDQRSG